MTWAPVKFFWQHSLHDLTATSVASGFDVSNLLNSLETDYWKGKSVSTQTIVFDAGSGQSIVADYFAIAGHNLKTAGGFVELQTFSSHIIYSNSWTEITCGATGRNSHSASVFSDAMFVFGGYSFQNSILNDLWKYSFTNYTWTQAVSGATRRQYHSAVVFSDNMYVFGGANYQGSYLNDLWKHSFTSCTWTQVTCGATKRQGHTATVFSDGMFVFGGYDYQYSVLNDLWKFTFPNCTWTQVTCGATPRRNHSAVVFSDGLYIFGGLSDQGSYLNDLWRYSFTNCSWTQLSSGATARQLHSSAAFNDGVYIFGGYDFAGNDLNDFWRYSFINCAWTQISCGATRRDGHSSVIMSNDMYTFGGWSPDLYLSTNDLWKTSLLSASSLYIDASSSVYGPAIPPDNNIMVTTFSATTARAWRMIVSSSQLVPYIAIAQWGLKQELGYIDPGMDPHKQSRKANVNISQTGYMQGIRELYTERQVELTFSNYDQNLYSGVSSWWDGNGLKNFFLQWEPSEHSSEIWLVHPDPTLEAPMTVGGLYRDIKITLRGRKPE